VRTRLKYCAMIGAAGREKLSENEYSIEPRSGGIYQRGTAPIEHQRLQCSSKMRSFGRWALSRQTTQPTPQYARPNLCPGSGQHAAGTKDIR
jgi:hypothetical protein